jgi:hypothetical protein
VTINFSFPVISLKSPLLDDYLKTKRVNQRTKELQALGAQVIRRGRRRYVSISQLVKALEALEATGQKRETTEVKSQLSQQLLDEFNN